MARLRSTNSYLCGFLPYHFNVSPPTPPGLIPAEIGGLTALQQLYLDNNALTGESLQWHLHVFKQKPFLTLKDKFLTDTTSVVRT